MAVSVVLMNTAPDGTTTVAPWIVRLVAEPVRS